jgi:hypothetical protein
MLSGDPSVSAGLDRFDAQPANNTAVKRREQLRIMMLLAFFADTLNCTGNLFRFIWIFDIRNILLNHI